MHNNFGLKVFSNFIRKGIASGFSRAIGLNFCCWVVMLFLAGACSQKLELAQEEVVATLTDYGKKNPENEILIHTSYGIIEAKLYNETPLHRANFVRLIKNGYYDDRRIYRIVKGICIQGGAHNSDRLNYLIPAEFNKQLVHKKGALSMARYFENNPNKMSSAAEFFIITVGNEPAKPIPALPKTTEEVYEKYGGYTDFDQEYTVFGEVTKGIEIATKIAKEEVIDTDKPLKTLKLWIELKK